MRLGVMTAVLACATLVAGCGSDENDTVTLTELAGDYTATVFEFVSTADPNTSFEAIGAGLGLDLSITASGDYTMTIHSPPDPDEVENGVVTLNGNKITLDAGGEEVSGTFTLNGTTLTLHLTSGVEFDFDGDDTDEPAIVNATLVRS